MNKNEKINCCDWRTRDECPRHRNFWVGWGVVSIKAPDIFYSNIFFTRKEAKVKQFNGTKIIKVKILVI